MSRPGQKPLEGLIAAISGLIAVYPDKTINTTGELMNSCLTGLLDQIMGEAAARELFEAALADIGPTLERDCGLRVVSTATLEKRAKGEADDLVARLRKGGL